MSDYVTIYERVHFNENGFAFKWERSFDRKNWEPVEYWGESLPFMLIKPIDLPGIVEREIRQTR